MSRAAIQKAYSDLQVILEKAKPKRKEFDKIWFQKHPADPLGDDAKTLREILDPLPNGPEISLYASLPEGTLLIELLENSFSGMKFYSYPLPVDNPASDRANWKARYPFSVLVGQYLGETPQDWNDGEPKNVDARYRHFRSMWNQVNLFLGLSGDSHADLQLANRICKGTLILRLKNLFDEADLKLVTFLFSQFPSLKIVGSPDSSLFDPYYYLVIDAYHELRIPEVLPVTEEIVPEMKNRLSEIFKNEKGKLAELKG
ncbi:MAG: hypothetical protein ACYCQJ_15505 [Nitrososphaerales archaeon]